MGGVPGLIKLLSGTPPFYLGMWIMSKETVGDLINELYLLDGYNEGLKRRALKLPLEDQVKFLFEVVSHLESKREDIEFKMGLD